MYLGTNELVALAEELLQAGESDHGAAPLDQAARAQYTQAWYTVLLRQTLEYAERTVPYYRERAAASGLHAADFEKLSDLTKYPILTRAELVQHYSAFFSEAATPEKATSTSGTTGRRLLVYGNREEDRAAAALRRIMLPEQAARPDQLTLRIIPGNRRTHISASSPNASSSTVTLGYDAARPPAWFDHTDHLIEVLSETYHLGRKPRRVSAMHITPPVVLDIITTHLLQRHIDPDSFGVADIALSGSFLSRQTKRLGTEVWQARVHHSYSCSEIRGETIAMKDDPDSFAVQKMMLCEVLDVDTLEPVAHGESGLVVFTSLYPFQQVMPLIRYSLGDIAQRLDDDPSSAGVVTALKPVGRIGECLRTGPRQFIGARDGFHALTSFPEIPQIPYPRFELLRDEDDPSILRLDVEVTLPGYQARGSATQESVAERLSEEIRSYRYTNGHLPERVICRFLPKNSISRFPKIVPDR